VRSHAKASTAGSTQRQATGLGRNRFAKTAVLAVAIAALLACAATSASAALQRNYESSFGSFSAEDPRAITVDQSNGDLYVISTATNTLSRFTSSGLPKDFTAGPDAGTNTLTGLGLQNFPSFDQVAIDNSGGPSDGNIYVTQSSAGQVKVFASSGEPLGTLDGSGTPAGSLGEHCGVAVDQANGDVYIASYENRVWRYSPAGATVVEGDYSGGIATSINPCQLAVAQGSLYAHNWKEGPPVGPGPVRKYATADFATGPPPAADSTTLAAKAFAIATDPANGDVYVDEGDKVTVYGSNGALQYSFGSGDFGTSSAGVAVRSGGNAYVSDPTNHEVDVYGPFSAPPPIIETKVPTAVKHTKATLHGHLDPNDSLPITGCEFEWGTDTTYSEAPVPCAEGNSFNAPADVSAELTGLTPGTTYHFRLHVTTGAGGFDGDDESFETTPPSSTPEVISGKGTILSSTSSELKGTVNPNANPLTECHFEYVDDIAFQATGFNDLSSGGSVSCDQAPGSIPADFEDHEVSATVTGLDPERIYRFRLVAENANGAGSGSEALVPGPPLVETTGSTYRTATTARFDSRVSAHGAATTYHFEYVTDAEFQANGFANAVSTPDVPLAVDEAQKIFVGGTLGVAQFKLSFGGDTTPDITVGSSAGEVQAALRALPSIGSPNVRVTLERDIFQTYIFTFTGALADADVDEIVALPGTVPVNGTLFVETQVDGGPSNESRLVSARVANLQPATAYRYRIAADNGTPGGASTGESMTLSTRDSDAPLSHGHLPGPPGSDRAWEQVNVPDTGGNNVAPGGLSGSFAISDDGNRAIYNISGGSPGSEAGGDSNQQFAERTSSGWETRLLYPPRSQAKGNSWFRPWGRSDLSQLLVIGFDTATSNTDREVWRLFPGSPAQRVYGVSLSVFERQGIGSDDGSRFVAPLAGSLDPDHPVSSPSPRDENLYDVTSGTPRLVSLLPDGSVPSCGARTVVLASGMPSRLEHWLTPDGSHLFFVTTEGSNECAGTNHLYVRDLEGETTSLIAPAVEDFILSTADAAFFTTNDSLDPDDEGGVDLYRYGLADQSLKCVTCFGGIRTEVDQDRISVSEDGSRAYFLSPHRLLPGASGRPFPGAGIYRVLVASGELAYVGPGENAGSLGTEGNAITPDGSVFVFRSDSPALNSVNGPQNGGTFQYYRYDDEDRSLVCASCPADGSFPRGKVNRVLTTEIGESGPNTTALADTGDLAFTTPTALVPADQNTARAGQPRGEGTDVYEWRDGRLLLVTDGLTISEADDFSDRGPQVIGVAPDGRDVFFTQYAQLTPDALDGFSRLYDARIGGGFEFPTPPPACSLEACQGMPRGVPEEPRPGSLDFLGSGNSAKSRPARCRKGKVRRRGRCVVKHVKRAKRAHNRANNDRGTSR
jgi:hypothetical protein